MRQPRLRLPVTAFAFIDEQTLAAGDTTGQISIFDLARTTRPAPIAVLTKNHGWVADLVMLPASDRPVLVAGALDGGTELWNVSDPAAAVYLGELPGGTYQVQDLATSRDGGILAIARAGRHGLGLQTLDRGQALHQLAVLSDTGDVNAVAVSPDGSRLVTLGRDRTLRGYRIDRDSVQLTLVLHLGTLADTDLDFVNDNQTMVIGAVYGRETFWDLDPDANVRAMCLGTGTPITAASGPATRPDCRTGSPAPKPPSAHPTASPLWPEVGSVASCYEDHAAPAGRRRRRPQDIQEYLRTGSTGRRLRSNGSRRRCAVGSAKQSMRHDRSSSSALTRCFRRPCSRPGRT